MENSNSILRSGSTYKCNYKNLSDGLALLRDIQDESIQTCFFDPQYQDVLINLEVRKRRKGNELPRVASFQMTADVISKFVNEIGRVLKSSGYLFLWVDSFNSQQLKGDWFKCTPLEVIDLITWDKGGREKGKQSEHVLVLQKRPLKLKEKWSLYNLPDVWPETILNKNHPNAKPVGLQMILIQATTKEKDYVLDPAAGGYSVLKACALTKRNFIGGDIEFGDPIQSSCS